MLIRNTEMETVLRALIYLKYNNMPTPTAPKERHLIPHMSSLEVGVVPGLVQEFTEVIKDQPLSLLSGPSKS